ncbi:F-box/LRR-repeat protein [Abeliophyllum distichum]|uniref:F-box/LRR-repeat protein n=1 Tax=Abeliophyllum distichum TaxID=126358 RepID=A0ABD1RV17_9LAMI
MKRTSQIRKIAGDDEERLSTLPDCVLCYVLSFLDTKYAVQTCVLSKRFKNLWSSLPDLNFDRKSFKKLSSFNNFVDRALTLRDNSVKVNNFKFSSRGAITCSFLDKVVNYAMSHGVQGLNLFVQYNESYHFPEAGYSSESLRIFELKCNKYHIKLKKPLSFPELKVLHLERVTFMHSDIVLSCPNLRDLTLRDCCSSRELDTLNINAPHLTKLTISSGYLELVAGKVVVSAPRLASFCYSGYHPLLLYMGELSGLEAISVDIDRFSYWKETKEEEEKKLALDVLNMLQHFHNAKSVTLSLGTIQILSVVPDLLAHERSPFVNMRSLKFKASRSCSNSVVPSHVMKFLLNSSSSVEVFMGLPRCKSCTLPPLRRRRKRCECCWQ